MIKLKGELLPVRAKLSGVDTQKGKEIIENIKEESCLLN